MSLLQEFQFAGGSTQGYRHRERGMNNQDGFCLLRGDSHIIAVVTDGCGSAPHSEVGARLGAELVSDVLTATLKHDVVNEMWLRTVRAEIENRIDRIAMSMKDGRDLHRIILDFWLFTIVGAVFTEDRATFFAIGDGSVFVNGEQFRLDPETDNTPPYMAYNILQGGSEEGQVNFKIVKELPLDELQHFMIATDGIDDVVKRAKDNLPGQEEVCGGPEQFWSRDIYFDAGRPRALTTRLKMLARDAPRLSPRPGLLGDDTTVIVGRRSPAV
jgi:hypothetical protein